MSDKVICAVRNCLVEINYDNFGLHIPLCCIDDGKYDDVNLRGIWVFLCNKCVPPTTDYHPGSPWCRAGKTSKAEFERRVLKSKQVEGFKHLYRFI